jgi:hypothetical protein
MATPGRTCLIAAGAAVLLLTLTSEARAQERSDKGNFTFVTVSSEEMPLGDGGVLTRTVQAGMVFAEDSASPFNRSATTCTGSTVVNAGGQATVVTGHCDMVDESGDVWTIWYSGGAEGGEWGFLGGTGKFDGVEGGGPFSADAQWADGRGINAWEATYTLP